MQTITIHRTGDAPLRFSGELIAKAGVERSPEENRWHEVAVYKSEDGRYVATIHFDTRWENESEHRKAGVCQTARAVAAFFRAHDPLRSLTGPPVDHPKRKLIESQVRSQYERAVSDVLQGEEFHENLELSMDDQYASMDREAIGEFVRAQLADFPLTRAEACAICDANNGAMLFPNHCWFGLAANVADADRLDGLGTEWEIDAQELAQRIQQADRGTQFALAWAVAQFWRHAEMPTEKALAKAGFTI